MVHEQIVYWNTYVLLKVLSPGDKKRDFLFFTTRNSLEDDSGTFMYGPTRIVVDLVEDPLNYLRTDKKVIRRQEH